MASRSLVARVLPKFPTRVVAGAGMLISKANGVWTFAVNGGNLGVQVPPLDTSNTYVFVQLPDGSTGKITLANAIALAIPVEFPGKKNAFINGGMLVWQRGYSIVPVAATRTYCADRWAVKTGAGTLTSVTGNNHGGVPPRSGTIMQIVGNAGVTTVDIDQRLEGGGAAAGAFSLDNPLVWAPQIAFSAYVLNNTGAACTPTLFVETPTALDNWAASNVVNGGGAGEALQSCPNGVWTRVTWLGDPSAYTNKGNGIGFRLRFPGGSLDSNTKIISVTDVMCEPRATADGLFSQFECIEFGDELLRCQRYYQKTFPYATKPAQNIGAVGALFYVQSVGASTAQAGMGVRYPVVMRAAPLIVLWSTEFASTQIAGSAGTWSASSAASIGDAAAYLTGTSPAGSAVGQSARVHLTLDAEL